MKRKTVIVLGLVAAISTSGGLVANAATGADSAPVHGLQSAAGSSVASSAPLLLTATSNPLSAGLGIATWQAPVGADVAGVSGYLVTFKEEGKEDQSVTTRSNFTGLPLLEENKVYEIEVKAAVISSKTGKIVETPVAKTQLKTGDFLLLK